MGAQPAPHLTRPVLCFILEISLGDKYPHLWQSGKFRPAQPGAAGCLSRINHSRAAKDSSRAARLWKLFITTLYISSFTFGGGFVIVTFMKKKFVDELHWIDEQEMLDMTALAQSAPGAIAVNAAILVGWQVEGLAGMLVAVLGTILPPMVILSIISVFYI